MNIGVVGCGNISDIYLQNCKRFDLLKVMACSDLDPARAQAKFEAHGVPRVCSTEEMLADPDIDTILDLTPPQQHFELGMKALEAGKHLYSEKPLALRREDGRKLLETAQARDLRIGCAPDTFLGAGLQTCRKIIDAGEIGTPVAAVAFMLCRGHELWHPDPEFFYQPGGGPVFDMGPYYITALVSLLGPVGRVTAGAKTTFPERVVATGPKQGQKFAANVPTHFAGLLEFLGGAMCTLTMSYDVWHHQLPPIEIYCTDGSLGVPDPNTFDGPVRMRTGRGKAWRKVNPTHGYEENSRGLGLADMARAIQSDRPHRAAAELAYHTLDVMEALHDSAREGRPVEVASRCEKPERMPQNLTFGQIGD
jgi:predicted dehydrogenase